MFKNIVLLAILILCGNLIYAQCHLRGRVLADSTKALPWSNVILFQKDTVFVKGTTADEKGRFGMKELKEGEYILQISTLGYYDLYKTLCIVKGDMDVGDITLTPKTHDLQEVTVEGKPVGSIDRRYFFPTAHQLRYSTNGLTLLQMIGVGRLAVDLVHNKVSTFEGGDVALCINGELVTEPEILALRPDKVSRIEYYDHPGIRYGNVSAVVDYITKSPEKGGVIALDLTDSPFVADGQNVVVAKLSGKRSEFGFIYDYSFLNTDLQWRELTRYQFADGNVLSRNKESGKNKTSYQDHQLKLNYCNREEGRYYLNITLKGKKRSMPDLCRKSIMTEAHAGQKTYVTDSSSTYIFSPAVDIYFERQLNNRQLLLFNLTGTNLNTEYISLFRYNENKDLCLEGGSRVKGVKQSWIGQGYYELTRENGRFTAGIKNNWSYTKNDYRSEDSEKVVIKYNLSEAIVQYIGRYKHLDYTLGAGLNYKHYSQEGMDESMAAYQVVLSMKYQFNPESYVGINFYSIQNSPDLASLNDVRQPINDLVDRCGNPKLENWRSFSNVLFYSYSKDWFNGFIQGEYLYANHPVMDETIRQNGHFLRTEVNQLGQRQVKIQFNFRLCLWKDFLSVTLAPIYTYSLCRGNSYTHRYSDLFYRGELTANYKNWLLLFQANNSYARLSGEILDYAVSNDNFMIMYKYKSLAVSLGISNFLGRDYRSNQIERLSKVAYSKEWSEGLRKRVFLKLSYTLSWGKRFNIFEQKIENEDTNVGILK